MKESRLICFARKAPESTKGTSKVLQSVIPPTQTLASPEDLRPRESGETPAIKPQEIKEAHDIWDPVATDPADQSCGDGFCKIPDEIPKDQKTPEKLDPAWTKVDISTLDQAAQKGSILLIGAKWCKGCTEAKKEFPVRYKGKTLLYVDYDTKPDEIDQKFKLDGSLPGKFKCLGKGKYEKLT
ncbi:hypothetical protein HN709_00440 [Candidatus Peregrinibacteria bacterium]|nr:hypothetical protein [Candidatus Peregrinibacteria bacterium]MBT7736136.1 hypothetical protein [Candidatus Peregrinibacteria bacterium]